MSKETPKKVSFKANAARLYCLGIGLAELATIYVFVTQNNRVLWGLAGVLFVDAAIRFGNAFLNSK